MELIRGTVDLTMSVAEITAINNLIERDKAKPIRKTVWEYGDKQYTDYKCPTCDSEVQTTDGFCKSCGQRLDTDNIKLGGE